MEQTKLTPSGKPSSHNDIIAKNRIALKEAKETRFRLRVCQRSKLLTPEFNPVIQESDELVKILGEDRSQRAAQRGRRRPPQRLAVEH